MRLDKAATAAYNAAYHAANRERRAAYNKRWREENHARRLADSKAWRDANPDYRRQNAEKVRAASRAWSRANREKGAAGQMRRIAAKLQRTPAWADRAAIDAVYAEAQAYRDLGVEVHVDHFYPLRGKLVSGLHVHNNLRVILAEENLVKSNRMPA